MDIKPLIFPSALIALNVGAAVMAFRAGELRKGLYFTFSACCLACVAFSK